MVSARRPMDSAWPRASTPRKPGLRREGDRRPMVVTSCDSRWTDLSARRTAPIPASGWIPCFIVPSSSAVGEPVVLHQALHITVERQVVAPEFPALAVLLRGDHVEAVRSLPLLPELDRLPAVADGLDQLG